jgi:diguanylate cyclase (GGDEF)-like protein/PAS domain S-box-containing protein
MYRIFYCLRDQHDWSLVLLAAFVYVTSCLVATLIMGRAQATQGAQRLRWVLTAGAAVGFGIWATHFIAMLAFDPGLKSGFDLKLTLLSLVCAMGLTAGGIEIGLSRSFKHASLAGGAVVGAGIACMHYLGMMALDVPGRIVWASDLVTVSILLGIALSAIAMWAITQPTKSLMARLGAPLLVLAIVSHHFSAMGAVTIIPDPLRHVSGLVLSPASMSLTICLATIAVLSLCAFAVISGQRFDVMKDESNRRFRILLEGLEDTAIFLLDPQGRVTDWKTGSARNNGYLNADIVGRIYADVAAVDSDFPIRYREALKRAETEGHAELEGPAKRADGRLFWGQTLLRALRDDDGKLLGFANITQEITERKAAEDAVKATARNLDAALGHMSQGLCLFDRNEKLILANRRFSEIYGLDPAVVQPGVSFRDLLIAVMSLRTGEVPDEATLETYHAAHRAYISRPEGGVFVSDYFGDRIMSIAHRPMPDGGWVSTFDDITESRASEARIAHMSRHDDLTGLPNRAHFNAYLDEELAHAEAHGGQLAVITLDLNRFKDINDQHGHAVGDAVLKALAERMKAVTQGENRLIARFGGDEFTLVKRYDSVARVEDRVRQLYDAMCAPIRIDGEEITVACAFGVALHPQDGVTREVLLNNADLALSRAKSLPGQTICYFDSAMDEAARDRNALAKDLTRALQNNEFCLFYQVQQSVETGQITGYEALIRWKHPERGFVSPVDFIGVAEESGSIIEIGAWVLRTACQEAVSWGNNLKIAVNLSPVQLNEIGLIETVQQVLIETGLSPSRLELEITESTIIGDKVRALHLLRQIKALGVTIAIDDFGTGYASLDTLNSFPFDKIKIDRSFLMEADKSPQARAIVRAILALGRSLGIPVLAEGVETASQLGLLREEGCEEAQGYLLGRPVEFINAVKAA